MVHRLTKLHAWCGALVALLYLVINVSGRGLNMVVIFVSRSTSSTVTTTSNANRFLCLTE